MPPREWRLRVEDILDAIGHVGRYTTGLTYEAFASDERTIEAVSYNLAVIGEAASNMPPEIQTHYPDIPWAKMRGMRNVLVHQYADVDPALLWDTCQYDLPPLVPQLRRLLEART